MKLLGKEDILGANDMRFEDVEVPEWGGSVRVRSLMGVERDDMDASNLIKKNGKHEVSLHHMRAKLCARSIVNEAGIRVFSDEDIEVLGMKSAAALNRVYEVAARLAGLTDASVQEIAKNSVGGQSDSSGSDSPSL